ncbi:MAG: LytTR family transcriptional regulator DNA-binding domain-containing protein [Bacteroidia bacterium]
MQQPEHHIPHPEHQGLRYIQGCPSCGTNLAVIQQGILIELPGKDGNELVCIFDILLAEADDVYVHFYVVRSWLQGIVEVITVCRTLKKVSEMPTLIGFMRVHRKHIINLRTIRFRGADGLIKLCLLPKKCIYLSRENKEAFDDAYRNYKLPH